MDSSTEASDDDGDLLEDSDTSAHNANGANQHAEDTGGVLGDAAEDIDPEAESALLQLQIQDVLDGLAARPRSQRSAVQRAQERLEQALCSIPEATVKGSAHSQRLAHFAPGANVSLKFKRPEQLSLTGPALFDNLYGDAPALDFALHVPAACFLVKDYLNHKYHAKRVLYLLHAGEHLSTHDIVISVQLDCIHGDVRRPILSCSLRGIHVPVRLSVVVPESLFTLRKLAPDRNCLRSAAAPAAPAAARTDQDGAEMSLLATPAYNAGLLADVLYHQHCTDLAERLQGSRIRRVALLLSHWLHLHLPATRFHAVLTDAAWLVLATCLQSGRVNRSMTTLQSFRAALAALAEPSSGAVSLADAISLPPDAPALQTHLKATPCAALDASGHLNLLAGVPVQLWQLVQSLATRTLALLTGTVALAGATVAAVLPTAPVAASCVFDATLTVQLQAADVGQALSADLPYDAASAFKGQRVLARALTDRAQGVCALLPPAAAVALDDAGLPGLKDRQWFCVGLFLDKLEAFRIVDRGPAADSGKQAAAFRQLWGARSEMRRFPDGAIHEAVAWDNVPPALRGSIPDQIVTFILERHLQGCKVGGSSTVLDSVMHVAKGPDANARHRAPAALDAALQSLAQRLRKLTGLSLAVLSTQVFGTAARHTAPFPPTPHPILKGSAGGEHVPRCVQPANMQVQLEGSGKWPQDEVAMNKVRAALGCELAAALETQFSMKPRACEAHVDVPIDGFVIRLHIWSDRDEALAAKTQRGLTLKGAAREAMVSSTGQAALQRQAAIQHHGLVAACIGEHPTAGAACRLALRWTAAQMLSYHIPEELVELLMMAVYSCKGPHAAPASPLTGFLRFLHLLATHEWHTQPLVVDPAAAMSAREVSNALTAYRKSYKAGSARPCAMITPYDSAAEVWTQNGRPSREVFGRACHLALTSYQALTAKLCRQAFADSKKAWQGAFTCDLSAFDALILLRREALPMEVCGLSPSALEQWAAAMPTSQLSCVSDALDIEVDTLGEARAILSHIPKKILKNLPVSAIQKEVLVGLDPLQHLLHAFTDRFGHCALFCADAYGGEVVGVKWRPQAFLPGPFKVATAHLLRPCVSTEPSDRFILDASAVISDIVQLGQGLVQDVLLCC